MKKTKDVVIERFNRLGISVETLLPEKPIDIMELEELRDYTTFFCEIPRSRNGKNFDMAEWMEPSDRDKIIDALSMEIDKRCEKLLAFYHESERKSPDYINLSSRYKLFSYNIEDLDLYNAIMRSKEIMEFIEEHGISVETYLKLRTMICSVDKKYCHFDKNTLFDSNEE